MRTDYKTSFLCTILTICMVLTGTPYSSDNRNTNHVLSYLNNINAGTGTVIVTGIGNYTGEIRQTFTIKPAKLTLDMFDEISDVVYSGAELRTDTGVMITGRNTNTNALLIEGTDFTVKYTANKNVGTAKAKIIQSAS